MVMKFNSFFQTDNVLLRTNFIIYIFKIFIAKKEEKCVNLQIQGLSMIGCQLVPVPFLIGQVSCLKPPLVPHLPAGTKNFVKSARQTALKPGSCPPPCTRGCRRWRLCRCWRRRARPAAPVLMFTTSKSSSYFRARSVPVSEGETPYVFTRFFSRFFLIINQNGSKSYYKRST